mgnify:CR=1 FL=1
MEAIRNLGISIKFGGFPAMPLKYSSAIVTGASTGIGRAISCIIAAKGVRVCLVGRSETRLQETEHLIRKAGGEAVIAIADLMNRRDIERIVSYAANTIGRVDIVANIAGVWHDQDHAYAGIPLEDIPPDQIYEVFAVNILAPFHLTRLLLPEMKKRKRGKILNISGTFAHGGAGWLHYYVSKQAVEYFTVGLADELRESRIQVNCISPSDVATDALKKFFPADARTALLPEEVAKLADFLLFSDVAENITGQVITIKSIHAG